MPYERLPARLRQLIPSEKGQEIFRNVVNSQLKAGRSESVAFASAWGALGRAGYEKGPDGKYERTEKARSRKDTLEEMAREHNAEHGDKGRVTISMLEQVFDRGVGAYRTNPSSVRPNVKSPEQWAYARVRVWLQALRTGKFPSGKFDTDLIPSKHPLSTKKSQPSASAVHVPSTNWEKPKFEKAEYQGRTVELDKPFRMPKGSSKKFGVYVKDGDRVKRIRFGDPNMEIRRDDPKARANFRSRHSCDTATDKTSARYWSCRMWTAQTPVSELTKRQIDDDSFTTPAEAVVRSMDLGLEGEIHVHERNGQAVYMPGENHEDYLERIREIAGIESEENEPVKEGLLERAISAIIGTIMQHTPVHKSVETQVLKLDDEQRIVYGWASVVTQDGEPVVDTQGDVITPEEMEKMANDFMLDVRKAKAMHTGNHIGEVIHSMPLTNELMKAFDIYSDREGWLVAFKIYDDDAWEGVKSGEYSALSIGGKAGSREAME